FLGRGSAAAEIVDSSSIGYSGSWDEASNWFPANIPNNTGSKQFNVWFPYPVIASLEHDVAINSLTLESRAVLDLNGATLTVLGTTTNAAEIGRDDED